MKKEIPPFDAAFQDLYKEVILINIAVLFNCPAFFARTYTHVKV